MGRLNRSDQTQLGTTEGWSGPVRLCVGMACLGAAVCLGLGAYGYYINHNIARALGGGSKIEVLGVVLPYPIAIALLLVPCLFFAFVAVWALFFPAQSATET